MREKPFYYVFLSLFLVFMVFSFPFQVMYLSHHEMKSIGEAFSQLTTFNWLTILGCTLSAYYAWNVSKKLNYFVGFLSIMVIANTFYKIPTETDFSIFKTSFASFLFLVPFAFMLVPEYQNVLKDKTRHWWKTAVRYKKEIPVKMEDQEQHQIIAEAKTINISKTGALLAIHPQQISEIERLIQESDKKRLRLKFQAPAVLETEVELIRLQKSKRSSDYELAVNFANLNKKERNKLISQVVA